MKTIEELSLAREKAVQDLKNYDCRILVCSGTGCIATGSNKIQARSQYRNSGGRSPA